MYAKTGMGLLAAAGVAVGVVGMTMGGASGAATCRPLGSTSAHSSSHRSADSDHSSSAANAANDSSANGAGSDSGTGAEGTGNGATPVTSPNPGTTIVAGVTVPDGVTDPSGGMTDPSGGSSSSNGNRSRPLLDLREKTDDSSVAGVGLPDTGNSVVVRSKDITGLHIFGSVNGR
jgi:hypothetical protein